MNDLLTDRDNNDVNPSVRPSTPALQEFERLMMQNCDGPFVFLHPHDKRDYDDTELAAVQQRTFQARLYISNNPMKDTEEAVFLRTRHSDHHHRTSELNFVRDYIKAAHVTKNYTAAKACLSRLVKTCLLLDENEYCTYAITVASGLSNYAENTTFQKVSIIFLLQ